jgi:glycosyltransferase involved in cell wall biosynthesis
MPALSVLISVYNGARFLGDALDSVLSQDFRDFECVIINDGSTDGSGAILDAYAARDQRVKVVHQANTGLVVALNRGLELCGAALIARMDADDVCLPGRFAVQVDRLNAAGDVAVLGGQIRIMNEAGEPIRLSQYPTTRDDIAAFIEHGSPLAHPAAMIRKDVLARVGQYRKAFAHAEDYELWLRIHDAGYAIENLDQPMIGYRQHGGNVSAVHRRQQALATLVARLAHRARVRGLVDPTASAESLDVSSIDLFPAVLRAGMEEEIFTLRLGAVSFASREEIAQALAAFASLPSWLRRSLPGVRFLLGAALASRATRDNVRAVTCVAHAFFSSPGEALTFCARQIANRLTACRAARIQS